MERIVPALQVVGDDGDYGVGVGIVLGNPVEAFQLHIVVVHLLKGTDSIVDIPLYSLYAVGSLCEVGRLATVEFTPRLAQRAVLERFFHDGLRNADNHAPLSHRCAYSGSSIAYRLVQSANTG